MSNTVSTDESQPDELHAILCSRAIMNNEDRAIVEPQIRTLIDREKTELLDRIEYYHAPWCLFAERINMPEPYPCTCTKSNMDVAITAERNSPTTRSRERSAAGANKTCYG